MKKYFIGALSIFSFMAMAQTQIIAHRGFWKTEGSAQNSIHALKGAQKLKVYDQSLMFVFQKMVL